VRSGDRERELRERIRELREAERGTVPPFRALWDGAAARLHTRPRPRLAVALKLAAAGVVLAVSVTLYRSFTDDDDAQGAAPPLLTVGLAAPPTITSWTSPTASLLRTPGAELLRSPPTLDASILDRLTATPAQPKGA